MTIQHTQVTTTIDTDIIFSYPLDEIEKLNTPKLWQNTEAWTEFGITGETISGSVSFLFDEREKLEIPKSSSQNTSTTLELSFEKEIESRITRKFADTQQRLAFPTYDEEDVLNWDAVVVPPPPRRSGTIRVKLIYKGRSRPIPIEDPWE